MVKRFVLSGYFGFKNFGDEAILSSLISKLKERKSSITVISSDPEYTRKQFKHINSVKTFDFPNVIGSIIKSNVLISGGGSLLQDVTSVKSLLYYLLIIFLGLFFRKKVIIFAQGIGPINSKIGQFLTKVVIKNCDYISVRDKKSHELLKNWGINSDLLCDPIFSLKIPQVEKEKVLAVQLRNCKGMSMDFLDRLADSVCRYFKGYKVNIYSFQDSIDLEICRQFERRINILSSDIQTNVLSGLTNDEVIEQISGSEYLISMRFHAIIIGLLSGVKTLGINYDIKVEKLSKEFDLPYIDLKKNFANEFEILQNQNLQSIRQKVDKIKFDWSNIEKFINI